MQPHKIEAEGEEREKRKGRRNVRWEKNGKKDWESSEVKKEKKSPEIRRHEESLEIKDSPEVEIVTIKVEPFEIGDSS